MEKDKILNYEGLSILVENTKADTDERISVALKNYVFTDNGESEEMPEFLPVDADTLGGQPPQYYATSNDIADIKNGTTSVGNAETLNGLSIPEFVVNDNLLINSYFKNPVNSSGLTEWTLGTTKTNHLDNWIGARVSTSIVEEGLSLAWDGINSTFGYIAGKLYNCIELVGETVTISAKINGEIVSVTGVIPEPGGSILTSGYIYGNNAISLFLEWLTNNTEPQAGIRSKSTEPYVVSWIKVEVGKVSTQFVVPNYDVEKLKCGIVDVAKLDGKTSDYFASKSTTF